MNENTEKLYTHEELENIVEQRLSRERKNRESLAKIRSVLNILRTKEPFKTLSNADIAEKLCELANEAETAENAAMQIAVPIPDDADCTADIQLKDRDAAAEQYAENGDEAYVQPMQTHQLPDENTQVEDPEKLRKMREISEFLAAYSEQTLAAALKDAAFMAFCKGKNGSILELYENYRGFLEALEHSPEARSFRAARAYLASTAFSGNASSAVDYGSMLTETQRDIANRAGMSYRRYAELLAQIPSKKLNYR